MSLIDCDSFDHYTTVTHKWLVNGVPTIGAFGRFGTNGLRQTLNDRHIIVPIPGLIDNLFVQHALNAVAYNPPTAEGVFLRLDDSDGTAQLSVQLTTLGGIILRRGNQTTGTIIYTSASGLIPMNASYPHLGFRAVIHNTLGQFQMWVNGVSAFNLINLDTQVTANAVIGNYRNGDTLANRGGQLDYDDLILYDASGARYNSFLGDRRIAYLPPNAAGDSAQFTPSPAVANYLNVDEAAPDGDTTYNASSTVGHRDTFARAALPGTGGADFVLVRRLYHRKDDAGARVIRTVTKSVAAVAVGANISPGVGYAYSPPDFILDDPNTAAPWTRAGLNAALTGYEVVT